MACGFVAGWFFLVGSLSGCHPKGVSIADSRNSTAAPVFQSATTKREIVLGVIFIVALALFIESTFIIHD
ncbi:hypothetical protein SH449x_001957 [Pirellulaceae bacterium SH449]